MQDIKEITKAIAHAEPGQSFKLHYLFDTTGGTVYTVGIRGNKKVLKTKNYIRGWVITGPASIQRIIGRPYEFEAV